MTVNLFVDAFGWLSSAAVVIAYALISMNKLDSKSKIYQWLNLFGSVGLALNTAYYRAFSVDRCECSVVRDCRALPSFVSASSSHSERAQVNQRHVLIWISLCNLSGSPPSERPLRFLC
jgi:hypothetical protein